MGMMRVPSSDGGNSLSAGCGRGQRATVGSGVHCQRATRARGEQEGNVEAWLMFVFAALRCAEVGVSQGFCFAFAFLCLSRKRMSERSGWRAQAN